MIRAIFIFILIILLFSCKSNKSMPFDKEKEGFNYCNITEIISVNEFEDIIDFVLKNGDKKTYRNFDNNNPHYKFNNFDVYLASDIGQRNINNDPSLSNFNELTIVDWESKIRYYSLIIVRKKDMKSDKSSLKPGMKEASVYLLDHYNSGLNILKNKLPPFINEISKVIKEKK